jgi:tetratricopeptide (TPR) repeat protein
VGEDLDLPDEIYGFGSWLLWVLATRATAVVDRAFAAGPARPSRHYGMVDGHPVPTPSLVAWLLTAAEAGLPADGLAQRDRRLDERQKVLRTTVSRAIGGEPRLFKDSWLRDLAAVCGLGQAELDLLYRCRGEEGYPVDPGALRAAIARTPRSRPADGTYPVLAGGPAPRSLPRDIASFTGRKAELETVMEAAGASAGGMVGIYAIGGMAGIGKTAFSVHAAHRLAHRFPAGQIFLPLHGHTPGHHPVDPADALASLLAMLGVPTGQIPAGLEARMAVWRDRVAERQLLLILDDAANSEQVLPLLPGGGGSLVLVTSRRHLSALEDATAVSLDTLPPGEAAALLARLAGGARFSAEDPAVAEITRLCGYLPLAIGMVARQLHHHPAWTAAARAAELAAAAARLELMETENLSVAAAFDLSYADLTEGQQRLFRRLGLHLGIEIDVYAVAALDGSDLAAARRGLEALYDQYLIAEPAQGRYRMHDLIREHSRALAELLDTDSDRGDAVSRLLDYYQHTAGQADALLARRTRPALAVAGGAAPAAVPPLPSREQALAWARAEGATLMACLDHAVGTGQHVRVIVLTAGIAAVLVSDGPWPNAIVRHETAIQAARQLGERLGEANALNDLGVVRRLTSDYLDAGQAAEQALAIYRDLGDRLGQANALTDIGVVRRVTGDPPGAASDLEQALAIYRDLGDQLGQANVLHFLGVMRQVTGDPPGAASDLEQALAIYRDLGDRLGEANVLFFLGAARRVTGDHPGAVGDLEQALAIYRDIGYRLGEANALNNLGEVRRVTGDPPGAASDLEQALAICRDIGYRLGEANVLSDLGNVRRVTGDFPGAVGDLEQALAIYRDIGDQLGQGSALRLLGVARRMTGDLPGAAGDLEQALAIYRNIGDRDGHAEVLNEIGTLRRVGGEPSEAELFHQQALELARGIGSAPREAEALAGLGRCAAAADDVTRAIALLRQAYEILQRIGVADALSVLDELDALSSKEPQRGP